MQRKRAEDAAAGRSAVQTAMAQLAEDAVQLLPHRHLQGVQRARRQGYPDRRPARRGVAETAAHPDPAAASTS